MMFSQLASSLPKFKKANIKLITIRHLPTPPMYFQNVKQGPQTVHNVVWKSQRDKHLPSVTKFNPPDDFLEQLNSQEYGPTTLLIPHSVSTSSYSELQVGCPNAKCSSFPYSLSIWSYVRTFQSTKFMDCPFQEFSSKAWDPKVQIPFTVDSGCLPRRVEIERRKREYASLAANFDLLLKEMNVDSQVMVGIFL